MFLFGYIVGLLNAALILLVAAALGVNRLLGRAESIVREAAKEIDRHVGGAMPIEKGFIYEPPSDDDLAREEIIEENAAAGKDTKISELI